MSLKRKAYASAADAVGERQVRVICSTSDVDRAGEVVVQAGIDTAAYMDNPVVLFSHDPNQPIARVTSMGLEQGILQATVQFPDAGVSTKADEVYGLVKAGVINTVSIGFQPTELLAMDPEQPRGPQRYVKSELLELSFVSVPANRGATIVARSHAPRTPVIRSLYHVGELAYALDQLGWLRDSAGYEAELEGDGSAVPAMIGEAMQQLGAALVAMTAEEVAELLATAKPDADDVAGLEPAGTAFVGAAAAPWVQKLRAGWLTASSRSGLKAGGAVPARVIKPVTKNAVPDRARRARAAAVAALG